MVTITGFQQRKSAEGKTFIVLELEGGLQVQQSQTGKLYASVGKCTLPCTFDEVTARELVGTTLPGSIVKVPCEPYSFTNPKTGESVTLSSKSIYRAPEFNTEEQRPVFKRRQHEIDVL